jgi:hypothetical protein
MELLYEYRSKDTVTKYFFFGGNSIEKLRKESESYGITSGNSHFSALGLGAWGIDQGFHMNCFWM